MTIIWSGEYPDPDRPTQLRIVRLDDGSPGQRIADIYVEAMIMTRAEIRHCAEREPLRPLVFDGATSVEDDGAWRIASIDMREYAYRSAFMDLTNATIDGQKRLLLVTAEIVGT